MKRTSKRITGLMAVGFVISLQAQGVLYDNGPVNGMTGSRTFNNNIQVADSFTLVADSIITNAIIGVWNVPGDSLVSLDWSITTVPFGGTTLASGTASINGSTFNNSWNGWDVSADSFSIAPAELPAGTYWLQLYNGATSDGNSAYWDMRYGYGDVNDVKSQAYQTDLGSIPSESFQLLGTAAPVPEPSTFVLAGFWGVGMLLARRRKN